MESGMEWSMSDTLELIDRYREKEVLWDTNNANYKLANERENAWNELAAVFETTPFQVKRKIKSLLASYRRERVKLHKSAGSKTEESSKWFAFDRLNFMKDIYTPRKPVNCETGGRMDVDFMAELLDVSIREGAFQIDDESEAEELVCAPATTVGTEYKPCNNDNSSNTATSNISNGGGNGLNGYPLPPIKKRKKSSQAQTSEEMFQQLPQPQLQPQPHQVPNYERAFSSAGYTLPAPFIQEFGFRRDELSVYGEHIANELRHLDRQTLCKVKHLINNIIYEAQMSSPNVADSSMAPTTAAPKIHVSRGRSQNGRSSRFYPDSRLSSPSSTYPSGIHTSGETVEDSGSEDATSSIKVDHDIE